MNNETIKKNILYICTPSSIHDQKWITYFAEQKEKYTVYVLYEKQNPLLDEKTDKVLKNAHINILNPIDSFSISAPFKTIKSILRIRKLIRTYNINIVHVLFATPYAIWTNFISTPYFITTRGSDVLIVLPALLTEKKMKGVYFKFLYFLFKKAFTSAKHITCTSHLQANKISDLFNIKNAKIIRTGIDVETVSNSKNKELISPDLVNKKFIISPRFFAPIYNIELQVNSIRYLPKEIINEYIFVFIKGKNFDSKYAESLILKLENLKNECGLTYKIEDYLSQEKLWTYFNFASLTILTPLSDGTPNSALEAMAAKCPLIIPDLNYDKVLFQDTCLILSENNPIQLANLITKALNNYPEQLLKQAFKQVNLFGNRQIEMDKLNDLYKNIR